MLEKRMDLYVHQGSSFSKTETWSEGVNLSDDYTAIMHVKYSTYDQSPALSLSNDNGISLNHDGSITISMTPDQTKSFAEYTAVYDIKMIKNDGTVFTPFWGSVKVIPSITKL